MTGNELKTIFNISGITGDAFAAKLGISRARLYQLFEIHTVPHPIEQKLIKDTEIKKGIQLSTSVDGKPVPLYDIDATAGNVTIFSQDGSENVKQHISVPAFSDCDMFISISGNSMYPKYCSGDLVALKKIEDFEVVAFGEAYVVVTKEQRFLKYIKKGSDRLHWSLESENLKFEAFEVPVKKVLHLYIVKGKIAKNII